MTVIDYILQADASGMLSALGKTEKALKEVDQQADKTGKSGGIAAKSLADKFEHTGAKLKGFGSAMTLGVTAPLVAGFTMMTAAAAEDAEAQEILARNLKQMAGASDEAVEGAEDYITELSKVSGVADDELRPALSKLVSATGDVGEAQELLSLALDMSVSKGKPVGDMAQALTRAYQGSTGALGKLGIATKDAEGKALSFSQIQQTLKTQVDGAAKAAGDTGAGGWRRAKVAFDEASESLGEKLLPFMTTIADMANGVLDFFDSLGPAGTTAAIGLGAVAIGLGPVSTGIGTVMSNAHAITGWFKNLGGAAATAGKHAATAASGVSSLVSNLGSVGSMAGGVAGVGDTLGKAGTNAKTAAAGVQTMGTHLSTVGDLGSATGGVATVGQHFSTAGKHASTAATSVGGFATRLGGLKGIAKGLGIAAIFAGAAYAFDQMLGAADRFRGRWNETLEHARQGPTALSESLIKLNERFNEISSSSVWSRMWQGIAGDTRGLTEEMKKAEDAFNITLEVLDEVGAKTGRTREEMWQLADTLKLDLSTGSNEAKTALEKAALGADGMAGSMDDMSTSVEDALDPLDELKKALDAAFSPVVGWEDAQTEFMELQMSIAELGADAELTGAKREAAARREASAVMDSYQQMVEAAKARYGPEADVTQITADHVAQLNILKGTVPGVREQADTYIQTLKSTPTQISTAMSASAPQQFVGDYRDALLDIPTERITSLRVKYADEEPFMARLLIARDLGLTGAQAIKLAKIGKLARGGPVRSGMTALVGEEGPELVSFGAAGRVHDAGTTQRILSSSTVSAATSITVNVAGSVISERDLVRVVEDGLARQRRQSGSLAFLN